MKSFLVLSAIVCVIFFSAEEAQGALPSCTAAAGTGCPQFSNCTAAGQPCQCNGGYHLNSAANGCDADIHPGAVCTTAGSNTECVTNATCTNVTEGGQKCTCNAGFHAMPGACAVDIEVGANCTKLNEDTECEDNATCTNTNTNATGTPMLQCMCKSGYHIMSGNCNPDIQLGGTCTAAGNDTECVDNAVCMTVTAGQTPMCTCKTGFHNSSGACVADKKPGDVCETSHECGSNAACVNQTESGPKNCTCNTGFHISAEACKADVGAGQVCTMVNATTECVDHATCKNISQGGNQTTNQCMCDEDYHPVGNATGTQMCDPDTCQHSVDKCKAAGMASCGEIVTYVGCVLTGVCKASDAEQVNVTTQALQAARSSITSDCNITSTNCLQNVSSCFLAHLKGNMSCTSVNALETCLSGADSLCTQGADAQTLVLAKATRSHMADTLSCKCVNSIETCSTEPLKTLKNTTEKCSAVKALFTCVVSADCDMSKSIDHRAVSALWSQAMNTANMDNCSNTITEEAATTCPLQLARCALIYGQENHNSTDKTVICKAAETFGKCLKDKTGACVAPQEAKKKLFTDQYDAINGTCVCENDVMRCINDRGMTPTDPAVTCPKMEAFSRCLMSAKCDMTQEKDPLLAAYKDYKNITATYNCSIPTNKSCVSGVTFCANTVITSVTEGGVSASNLCKVGQAAMQCVNAANCSEDTASDNDLVTPFTNGTLHRMQTGTCPAPECLKRYKDVMDCKTTYQTALTAAGADSKKKCTAMNNMVKCLRVPFCNPYLKDMVNAEYLLLKALEVTGCNLLTLTEPSGASTPHTTLLAALLTGLLGFIVVRM